MKGQPLLIGFALSLMACASLCARPAKTQTVTAEQAIDHVGQTATVCGKVVSPHYAYKTRGRPTFLNLDRAYPHEIFTVVIWGRDRAKLGQPEKEYRNKPICVTGAIKMHRGVPEIVARTPRQIELE